MREHVRAPRAPAPRSATAEAEPKAAPLFAMDGKRVLTAGLFNFSLAVIAGLFGVTQTMGDALGFDPFERRNSGSTCSRGREPLRDLIMAHRIVAAVAGSMLLVLLGIGTGLVRTSCASMASGSTGPKPASPPPRPAHPDRRHAPGQAGAGGDPRHRPRPRRASAGGS